MAILKLISFEHDQTDENTLSKFPILYKSNNLSIEMMYNVTPSTFRKKKFYVRLFSNFCSINKIWEDVPNKKEISHMQPSRNIRKSEDLYAIYFTFSESLIQFCFKVLSLTLKK